MLSRSRRKRCPRNEETILCVGKGTGSKIRQAQIKKKKKTKLKQF